MNNQEKTLKEFLNTCKGNAVDVCTYLYVHYIKDVSDEESINNFIFFLNNNQQSKETFEIKETNVIDESIKVTEIFQFINNVINNIANKNVLDTDFYYELLCKIKDKSIFENDLKSGIAILAVKINSHIPYFQLDQGLKISDEEYQKISNNNINAIKKALYIINANLEQKTEISSLLLKLLNEETDTTTQAVILSHVIGFYNQQCQNLFDQIESLKSKTEHN